MKNRIIGRPKKYNTEEERKAANKARDAAYRAAHKDEIAAYRAAHKEAKKAYNAAYRATYKEEIAAYRATPFGRASNLVRTYRSNDKKSNRGECTIDAQWIVDNVFSGQVCHYCGETDWHKLGCDRKDSSLPHTPENCVPCCKVCNEKKHTTPYEEYLEQINKSDTD